MELKEALKVMESGQKMDREEAKVWFGSRYEVEL